MKRTLLAFIGFVAALSVLWVGVLQATDVRSGEAPVIMENETINGTLYAAGREVTVDGKIEGDIICAGQKVRINGIVEGDVLCAAQDITIDGHVGGDVRLTAQDATVDGSVDGSVSMAVQTGDIAKDAIIGRDVAILAQSATVGGSIGRDVQAITGSFSVTGSIGRDLGVTAESVTLRDGAVVNRNFTYVSQADATVKDSARVVGTTDHKIPEQKEQPAMSAAAYVSSVTFGFAGMVLVGLALMAVTPNLLRVTAESLQNAPLATIGAGFMGMLFPPFIAVMLLITVIGIPLGVIVFLVWVTTLMVGTVFTAQALGNMIIAKLQWQYKWDQLIGMGLGLLALFLLTLIPFIGGFIAFVAVLWGIGALWYAIFKHFRGAPQPEPAVAPATTQSKKAGDKK